MNRSDVIYPPTASGKDVFPTLTSIQHSKIWLGNQEAFSGDYWIVEETPTYAIEGNGCRPSHKGSGISDPDGNMYTLNTTEVHGVMYPVYGIDQQGGKGHASYSENVMPTILSDSHGTPHAVAYPEKVVLMDQGGQFMKLENDLSGTIRSEMGGHAPIVLEKSIWVDRHVNIGTDDLAPTLCAKYGTGGNNMPCVIDEDVYENHVMDARVKEVEVAPTLTNHMHKDNDIIVRQPVIYENHPNDSRVTESKGVCPTLNSRMGTGGNNVPLYREQICNEEKGKEMNEMKYVVRRITPRECERLQGFPDDYTKIPWAKGETPDSHRYKALGNSFAVPVVRWIGERIDFALSHPITEDKSDKIAYQTSLFDF